MLARPEVLASVHWQVIGTVDDTRTAIIERFEAGADDGFVAVPGGSPESLHLTLEALIPKLADAGYFRTSYLGDMLADHLG